MKKILFKYENGTETCDIENISQEELLVFICEVLENLIQNNIVTRDIMLTSINLCLTVGSSLSEEELKDKEIYKLIDEVSDSMLELFRGVKSD